jgi:hypothetical protein
VKANPYSAPLHILLTHSLLRAGDAKQAESHALWATELAPLDQSGWAYLTIIWRMLGDAREHWLADYHRLVMPIAVPTPEGYGGDAAFLDQLAETVTTRHNMRAHPAEQSLRGGTQTRSNLFEANAPILRDLAHAISLSVERELSKLPVDARHPFLGRLTGTTTYAGSWSVRLRDQGFHINHIHPSGWLSSAYYVSLPLEIMGEANSLPAGALAFGVPDDALGITLAPRRIERPEPGKLVIFPSYLWHGTIPFRSETPRLTIAFDALPV